MWIRSKSRSPFAVKIYLGAMNVIFGEPLDENTVTIVCYLNSKFNNKSI